MDNKICLDSDIMIELLKNNQIIIERLQNAQATFSTTPINILELWNGRKKSEEQKIEGLINQLEIIPMKKEEGEKAGDITKKLRGNGEIIDMRDIIMAAICIQNNIPLMTLNTNHFERLKKFGLKLI